MIDLDDPVDHHDVFQSDEDVDDDHHFFVKRQPLTSTALLDRTVPFTDVTPTSTTQGFATKQTSEPLLRHIPSSMRSRASLQLDQSLMETSLTDEPQPTLFRNSPTSHVLDFADLPGSASPSERISPLPSRQSERSLQSRRSTKDILESAAAVSTRVVSSAHLDVTGRYRTISVQTEDVQVLTTGPPLLPNGTSLRQRIRHRDLDVEGEDEDEDEPDLGLDGEPFSSPPSRQGTRKVFTIHSAKVCTTCHLCS